MSDRSLERLAHRVVIAGVDGHAATAEALSLVEGGLCGVILFARNVASPEQVAELSRALKERAGRPLLVSVDQEGGRVARLKAPWTEWPPLRRLGETGDEELAHEVGRALGAELKSCGIDLDYAPVLDVDSNPQNPVIGDRAFSREPQVVARLGAAMIRGLQAVGVAACGKHFPGHGDTSQDSHVDLPRLPHGLERLRAVELVPFRAAVEAGVATMMTAHVVFEALDPGVPATMSRKALDGLLRRELGFSGAILSDDLGMKAVHQRFPLAEVIEGALNAGVDGLLSCNDPLLTRATIEQIVRSVEAGRLARGRLAEAAGRMEALAARFACEAGDIDPVAAARIAGLESHRSLSRRVATG